MLQEELSIASVVKLSTIVTLEKANGKGEVSEDVALKMYKKRMNIGFRANRKGSYIVRKIIHGYKVVLKTRHTRGR